VKPHTPGPWQFQYDADGDHAIFSGSKLLAVTTGDREIGHDIDEANARLMASAPDHALIAAGLCSRVIRWETKTNELCFDGLRYSTKLDEFGVPELYANLRAAIRKILEAA
jgi:hypothetical protein